MSLCHVNVHSGISRMCSTLIRRLMQCSRIGFRSLRIAEKFGALSDHTAVKIKCTAFRVLKSTALLKQHTD